MSQQSMPAQQSYDHQKRVHEVQREDAQRAHDRNAAFAASTNEAAINNANLALRTAVIINGGAVISVLAFVGGLVGQGKLTIGPTVQEISCALAWFAFGVAAATFAMGFSYLTNYCIAGSATKKRAIWEHPYFEPTPTSRFFARAAMLFKIAAILLGFGSIGIFIMGMLTVRDAFGHLG